MNHSFDVDMANKYGIEEAILIQFLQFWIGKNRANGKHFYDGRTWTYNTASALLEMFPYFKSEKKAQRVMRSLEDKGVVMSGCFNQNPFDRTKWYSFIDESTFLPETKTSALDGRKRPLSTDENVPSLLTVVDTVKEPVNKAARQARKDDSGGKFSPTDYLVSKGVDPQVANDWLALRKARRAAVTLTAIDGIAKEADKAGISLSGALEACCQNGWQGFKADWLAAKAVKHVAGSKPQGQDLLDHNMKVARDFAAKFGNPQPAAGDMMGGEQCSVRMIDFFGAGENE